MSSNYSYKGGIVSEKQLVMLCRLVKGPLPLDGLTKWDTNCLAKLEDMGFVDVEATEATLLAEGRAAVVALNAKVNGKAAPTTAPAPKRAYKPRAAKPAIPAKSNGHGSLDLAAIRAQIVARYEADLAAVDRLAEIASALK